MNSPGQNPFLLGRFDSREPAAQFAAVAQVRADGRARLTGSVFTGSQMFFAVVGPLSLSPGDRVNVQKSSGTYYIIGKVEA